MQKLTCLYITNLTDNQATYAEYFATQASQIEEIYLVHLLDIVCQLTESLKTWVQKVTKTKQTCQSWCHAYPQHTFEEGEVCYVAPVYALRFISHFTTPVNVAPTSWYGSYSRMTCTKRAHTHTHTQELTIFQQRRFHRTSLNAPLLQRIELMSSCMLLCYNQLYTECVCQETGLFRA